MLFDLTNINYNNNHYCFKKYIIFVVFVIFQEKSCFLILIIIQFYIIPCVLWFHHDELLCSLSSLPKSVCEYKVTHWKNNHHHKSTRQYHKQENTICYYGN